MRKFLQKLRNSQEGATAIEYGLIAALLSIGIIAAVQGVRGQLQTTFNRVNSQLASANSN